MADPQHIAVDEKRLAEALGLEEWPAHVRLDGFLRRMTARVITDSTAYQSSSVEQRFANAEDWITRSYQKGVDWGRQTERAYWQSKIRSLFGLDS